MRLKNGAFREIFYENTIMRKRYKSEILQIVHEDAVGNFEIGAIDAEKMKEFDEMCLEKEMTADARSTRSKSIRSAGGGFRREAAQPIRGDNL